MFATQGALGIVKLLLKTARLIYLIQGIIIAGDYVLVQFGVRVSNMRSLNRSLH